MPRRQSQQSIGPGTGPVDFRMKRISSANKSGPFVGSEFAFEDLVSQEVDKFSYRWIADHRDLCGWLIVWLRWRPVRIRPTTIG